jgi:tape measure domain-containing protein
MADNIPGIRSSAVLDPNGWLAGVRDIQMATSRMGRFMRRSFTLIDQNTRDTTKGLKNMGLGLKDLGRITSGIVVSQVFYRSLNAIRAARDELIRFTMEMERLEVAFSMMFNDRTLGRTMVDLISELAAKTDLEITGATNAARKLQAMGFEAEYVVDVLSVVNDQVAFMGGDLKQMDSIVYALGQIRNSAKLSREEVRQLINAFVPANQILSEEFGLTPDQVRNVGDMGISGEAAAAAFIQGMRKRTEGSAAILAESSKGLLNNIRENIMITSNKLAEGVRDVMRQNVLLPLSNGLERVGKVAAEGGIGAVLDTFLSKGVADSIRMLAGSILLGVRALSSWYKALRPATGATLQIFLKALSVAIPAVHVVSITLAELVGWLIRALPAVRYLAVALTTLFVANAVAKSFLFLWGVLRGGAVIAVVTSSFAKLGIVFTGLNVAIRALLASKVFGALALSLVATKILTVSLIVLLVSLAAAFIYVAAGSKTATNYLHKFNTELSKALGVNTTKLLQNSEKSKEQLDKEAAAREFLTQTYPGLTDAQKKAAKGAEDAAKRTIASFDEVFQIKQADEMLDTDSMLVDINKISKALADLFGDIETVDLFGDIDKKWWAWLIAKLAAAWIGFKALLNWLRKKMPKPPDKPPKDPKKRVKYDRRRELFSNEPLLQTVTIAVAGVDIALKWLKDFKDSLAKVPWKEGLSLAISLVGLDMVYKDLTSLKNALANVPWRQVVTVTGYTVLALAAIAGVIAAIALIPKFVVVAVSLAIAAAFFPQVESVVNALGTIPKTVTPAVSVNSEAVNPAVNGVLGELQRVPSEVSTKMVFNTQEATTHLNSFKSLLAEIAPSLVVTARLDSSAVSNDIANLQKELAKFNNATAPAVDAITAAKQRGTDQLPSTGAVKTTVPKPMPAKDKLTTKGYDTDVLSTDYGLRPGLNSMFYMGPKVEATAEQKKLAAAITALIVATAAIPFTLGGSAPAAGASFTTIVGGGASTAASTAPALFSTAASANTAVVAGLGATATLATAAAALRKKLNSTFGDKKDKDAVAIEKALKELEASGKIKLGDADPEVIRKLRTVENWLDTKKKPSIRQQISPRNVRGLATGGIVQRDMIARIGEGNKREAIVPLERSDAVQQFARAIADELGGGRAPNYYMVGTLIADNRSLTEFERRLQAVRVNDLSRVGGA